MAATKLQVNWSAVSFTPSGGSLQAITKVNDVQFDPGGQLLPYSGDTDRYPTTIINQMNNPRATVRSGDVANLQGFVPGTVGTFNATFKDAKLATGGDMLYVLSNAVIENAPGGGTHAQYGEATLSMLAYSSDGVTSPLAFTRS
jgi:hypothetical protein